MPQVGYMKSIGDKAGGGRVKESTAGNLWDWMKSKIIDTYIFYIGGYRIVNSQQFT